jgi:hypothetical protein
VRVHVTLAKAKKESSRLGYGYGCEEREKGQSNERERQRGEKECRVCHVMVGVMERRCCCFCCFVATGEARHHQIICLWCSQFMYRYRYVQDDAFPQLP